MRTKLAALALTAGLATSGVALVVPAAFAQTASPSASASTGSATDSSAASRLADRVTGIKDALKGLVTDGTLTQAQADKVATTLSTSDALRGGRGGHGGVGHLSPDAVAKALGITTDQLRTQEQAGKTLSQIAATKGISKADLVTRLVAAAKAQLAADVASGRITQAQSDAKAATLTADITEKVDQVHTGRGGHGDHDGDRGAAPGTTTSGTTTPGTTASSTPTTTA